MMSIQKIYLLLSLLVILCLFANVVHAENIVITDKEQLTLDKCVDISIKNNPKITVAKKTTKVLLSKIGQAKSNYYPQVNLNGEYITSGSTSGSASGFIVNGNQGSGGYTNLTAGTTTVFSGTVSANQLVYDFGKTPTQVKISKLNLNSAELELENTINDTIYTVKQAYFEIIKAQRTKEVYNEVINQYELHLRQAEGFYKVGTKARIDVTAARVNLSKAKLNYIKANNALKLAIASLNSAMGIPDPPEYEVVDNFSDAKYQIKLDDALQKALISRPDYQSLETKRLAAQKTINLAKKGYYPVLSGFANYGFMNRHTSYKDNWSFGMNLKIPVFKGFLTRYQIREARANLELAEANQEVLRQAIFLQVKQAYLNVMNAEETIPANEDIVDQAKENLDLANGRYGVGVGSYIEVQDAMTEYSNAKLSYIQSVFDYKIALSNLEKTMGER